MSVEAPMITMPEYEELIQQRMQKDYAYESVDSYVLEAGKSSLAIRAQGGFVTGQLTNHRGELVPVFYRGEDPRVAKLRASHFASPMGESEGLGGQHGWPRWTDWDIATQLTSRGTRAIMQARTPENYFQLKRVIELRPYGVTFTNFLKLGRGQSAWNGSVGEHNYFDLPTGHPRGLEVEFPALTPGGPRIKPLKDSAVFEQVMAGTSHFCPEFNGHATVAFPEGKKLLIASSAEIEDYPGAEPRQLPEELLGMLLWRSPSNPDSFCAEPTLGVVEQNGQIHNQALHINPGALIIVKMNVSTAS